MEILENVSLASYTTFHIGGPARFFCLAQNVEELSDAASWARAREVPILILGGGSNMLVNDAGFNGLVLHFANKGLEVVEQAEDKVTLKIAAGEVWDDVVKFTVEHNWWGVENLSHIPGLAGGFAVQNVGAYGQEAGNVVKTVEAFDLYDQKLQTFTQSQCKFDYRHSLFNTTAKGRYVIVDSTIVLSSTPKPNITYGDLVRYFAEAKVTEPSQDQIRQAIIEIRNRKFPFPTEAKNGNTGSFFRGGILTALQIEHLYQKVGSNFGKEALERLHTMTDWLMADQGMKTPTGFLIEMCGLKGYQVGGAKVHEQHAAMIINATGQAVAKDVLSLFTYVARKVYHMTGIMLHIEPELVGFSEEEKEQILDSVVEDGIL